LARGAQWEFTFLYFRENPKLHAAVESHPNVEKHDVRMGHPARFGLLTIYSLLKGENETMTPPPISKEDQIIAMLREIIALLKEIARSLENGR